jgi:7-cyano-7-deazaguanine synthase
VIKAVALLSGGLDSAVAMAVALRDGREVYPVSFHYGQKHEKELESAHKIVDWYKRFKPGVNRQLHSLQVVRISNMMLDSALTDTKIMPLGRSSADMSEGIPVTYVPARNSIFLAIASGIAESVDADEIYVGFNCLDYSGYPDCRPEFVGIMQTALGMGTKRGVEGNPIRIQVPIILNTKEEIVRKGLEMSVPMEFTWSCYCGLARPCGACDSCQIRDKAFKAVGIPDPALE